MASSSGVRLQCRAKIRARNARPAHTRVSAINVGEVDGYGLYPFTPKALWIAASRANKDSMPERLNPRILQNDLLVEVLDDFRDRDRRVSAIQTVRKTRRHRCASSRCASRTENRDPQNYERWAAFLELYDGTGTIANLDERLRAAFEVPEIPGADAAKPIEPTIDAPTADAPQRNTASKEDLLIEQWLGGQGMEQTVADKLRRLVFSAVSNAIDWDMLGLASRISSGRLANPSSARVLVLIVRPRRWLAICLSKSSSRANWFSPRSPLPPFKVFYAQAKTSSAGSFPMAKRCSLLSSIASKIRAKDVEAQLRDICRPTPQWNQAAAAVELLCVGAAIGGKIKPDAKIADMIDAAFSAQWASECASTAPDMKSLYDKLTRQREKLVGISTIPNVEHEGRPRRRDAQPRPHPRANPRVSSGQMAVAPATARW